MHQEPPDKLFMAERDLPFRIPRGLSPCREGDFCFRDGKDPAVGDCNPMCIPPQIFDGVTKTVKGLFDVRAPVFPVMAVFKFVPGAGLLQ